MDGFSAFYSGEYVVCPGHGVGEIMGVEKKNISGEDKSFYTVMILGSEMRVMVPTDTKDGLRSLVSLDEVKEIFELLGDHDVALDTSTWNRRYRDYLFKIKTGALLEIADVLRSLFLLRHIKSLSFGEKKMLKHCKGLLVKEIALSQGKPEDQVDSTIESYFVS